mmetsp:Transcript_22782/g.69998  ORF Transcript_22782/g.69998 Transcript_22782/m.69998 type:complete len:257 (-) Transcript_22782:2036-2806(-)
MAAGRAVRVRGHRRCRGWVAGCGANAAEAAVEALVCGGAALGKEQRRRGTLHADRQARLPHRLLDDARDRRRDGDEGRAAIARGGRRRLAARAGPARARVVTRLRLLLRRVRRHEVQSGRPQKRRRPVPRPQPALGGPGARRGRRVALLRRRCAAGPRLPHLPRRRPHQADRRRRRLRSGPLLLQTPHRPRRPDLPRRERRRVRTKPQAPRPTRRPIQRPQLLEAPAGRPQEEAPPQHQGRLLFHQCWRGQEGRCC